MIRLILQHNSTNKTDILNKNAVRVAPDPIIVQCPIVNIAEMMMEEKQIIRLLHKQLFQLTKELNLHGLYDALRPPPLVHTTNGLVFQF